MPVIAAGVVNKAGRILVARCFMDVTRIRVEGLLSAFPKLLGTGASKTTTFIDSGSVRYLYQPVEGLFLVVVTTKASNIMEDLATLRLLGRVLPEYCPQVDEVTIVNKAFEIMFAMDEIVTNGAREATTMDQVLTALEMRSEGEERAKREQEEKERDAAKVAKQKAKEMKQKRMDKEMLGGVGAGYGSSSMEATPAPQTQRFSEVASTEVDSKPAKRAAGAGGMSLSNKRKQDQTARVLAETGAPSVAAPKPTAAASNVASPTVSDHPVTLTIEEKISASLNRDGGVSSVDIKGTLSVCIVDSECANVRVVLGPLASDFAFKTHPNINKQLFATEGTPILAIKDARPYPTHQPLGILRWSAQALSKQPIPLSVNCWPSDSGATIEYELENNDLVLDNVVISLPLAGAFPTVNEISQGEFQHDGPNSMLHWFVGRVHRGDSSGSMDVQLNAAVGGSAFFPAQIQFKSATALAQIKLIDVVNVETGASVPHGLITSAVTEQYVVN